MKMGLTFDKLLGVVDSKELLVFCTDGASYNKKAQSIFIRKGVSLNEQFIDLLHEYLHWVQDALFEDRLHLIFGPKDINPHVLIEYVTESAMSIIMDLEEVPLTLEEQNSISNYLFRFHHRSFDVDSVYSYIRLLVESFYLSTKDNSWSSLYNSISSLEEIYLEELRSAA